MLQFFQSHLQNARLLATFLTPLLQLSLWHFNNNWYSKSPAAVETQVCNHKSHPKLILTYSMKGLSIIAQGTHMLYRNCKWTAFQTCLGHAIFMLKRLRDSQNQWFRCCDFYTFWNLKELFILVLGKRGRCCWTRNLSGFVEWFSLKQKAETAFFVTP